MQNNLILLIATIPMVLGILGVSGCSNEKSEVREIRAHTHIIEGIPHAEGLKHPDRLCQSCHGVGLQGGGQNTIPSCYQCHGQNWESSNPSVTRAPSDHTVIKGIFLHKAQLMSPMGDCDSCHGTTLQGAATTPSCLLCHEQKWP